MDYVLIANATSVAFGKDPSKMAYKESVMREHLYRCFSRETLESLQKSVLDKINHFDIQTSFSQPFQP